MPFSGRQRWIAPPGLTREQHAEFLGRRVAALYPSDAFNHRRRSAASRPSKAELKSLEPLLANNTAVAATPTNQLDFDAIPGDRRRALRRTHERVWRFSNANPGLRFDDVLEDTGMSVAQRVDRIQELTDAAATFQELNADIELLHLDYTPGSADVAALDFGSIPDADRPLIIENEKAYQRIYAISADPADAATMIATGFHSAAAIAAHDVKYLADLTGFGEAVAGAYYDRSLTAVSQAGLAVTAILDAIQGGFNWTAVDNTQPTIADYFKKIDGFEELFGDQAFCACEHCRSILSPAAYFVDLMCFIEANVLDVAFSGDNADHVLALRERRPDLWTLVLSCDNTLKEIPQLLVVNEILENYIANRQGFAGDLTDRAAVSDFVYRTQLSTRVDSFAQPTMLPLDRLEVYLSHFERRRADLLAHTSAAEAILTAARLGLSETERNLIATPRPLLADLIRLYGISFQMSGSSTTKIRKFDAQMLLAPMGVSRSELSDFAGARFVTNGGADPITIKGERRNADSVQNDIERVSGLTLDSLDRMHRMVRLWRATPWTIRELDLVGEMVRNAGRLPISAPGSRTWPAWSG